MRQPNGGFGASTCAAGVRCGRRDRAIVAAPALTKHKAADLNHIKAPPIRATPSDANSIDRLTAS